MKKRLLAWLLIFSICFGMTACGTTPDETENKETLSVGDAAIEIPKDPEVIATAVTGQTSTELTSIAALSDAVDASGNTYIIFWQNVTDHKPIRVPYSCTIDFNGYTVNTSPEAGNGIEVGQAGTENAVTTVKNGTLTQYGIGVRVDAGGIIIENMTIRSIGGASVALLEPSDAYKSVNCVKDSTLSSRSSCISFYADQVNFSKTGITVENSTLISYDADGSNVFDSLGNVTIPGTITLGQNVELYSYSNTLAPAETFCYGGTPVYRNMQEQSVTVDGTQYKDICHWSTKSETEVLNVLMIGNSFCYYFVQELYGVANAAGVELNLTNLYKSGCFLEEHWTYLNDKEEGSGKYSYWVTNSMGRWRPEGINTSDKALEYMQWDVITLQQHFRPDVAATYESAKESCVPYAEDLFTYLKTEHPDAKLYWQETWAYQVGHQDIPDAAAQTNQQNNIIRVSREVCEENQVDMVPSGDAWVIARNDPKVGDTLCNTDLYHDGDVGGGQYLNACVWFEVLTGKSCIGNTWRPTYDLSEEKITQLQIAAHQAVAAQYGEDYAK